MPDISIQTDADLPAIESLMADAFGPKRHGRSVWQLRPGPPVADLCLVIRSDGETVGSLRFWEVMLGDQRILLLGPLAVRPRGDGDDVLGVLDGREDARGEHELLPRLADVDDVDAVLAAAPDVLLHHVVGITRADVALRGQHLLDSGGHRVHQGRRAGHVLQHVMHAAPPRCRVPPLGAGRIAFEKLQKTRI